MVGKRLRIIMCGSETSLQSRGAVTGTTLTNDHKWCPVKGMSGSLNTGKARDGAPLGIQHNAQARTLCQNPA